MHSVIPSVDRLGSPAHFEKLLVEVFADRKPIRISDVREYCASRLYHSGIQVNASIEFLINIGVLDRCEDDLVPGKYFEKVATSIVSPSGFGEVVAELLINELAFSNELQSIFVEGSLSWDGSSDVVLVHSSHVPFRYVVVLSLFREIGVLSDSGRGDGILQLCPQISRLLKQAVLSISFSTGVHDEGMSLSELKELQARQSIQGDLAEKLVVEFERARLFGHPNLSLVRRVSEENVSAGYDIMSFEEKSSLIADRFIEVKSYAGDEHFYWSIGEISTAKRLRNSYYLYLVDVGELMNPDYQPTIIRNPATAILEAESIWSVSSTSWHVRRNKLEKTKA